MSLRAIVSTASQQARAHLVRSTAARFRSSVCVAYSEKFCRSGLGPSARLANKYLGSRGVLREFCTRVRASSEMEVNNKDLPLEPEKFPTIGGVDGDASTWKGDLLVIGVFEEDLKVEDEDVSIASDALKALDEKFGGAITHILSLGDFKGKPGSSDFVRAGGDAKIVGVVGLGPAEKATLIPEWGESVYQKLGGAVAGGAKSNKAKTVGIAFASPSESDLAEVGGKIASGIWLGAYEATRFKKEPKVSALETVELIGFGDVTAAVERSEFFSRGVLLSRYLVESPPNICSPQHLVENAQMIADQAPDVMKLKVLEKQECVDLKMGCYLAVAEASDFPPKFIHLTYTPEDGVVNKKVALVGKGLTFDSGGYNIKLALMELMKFDMGGSAATLGAAKIISKLKPKGVEIHFIIAACENMISGSGYRPGDVLTASNGTTVEVLNTDAEGRLTLADALIYAQEKCEATTIVDSATLTGACIVALGKKVAGLFTPSEKMAESLLKAAKESGEKLWRMPLEDEYLEDMKSPIADLKNIGSRWGGAITAGLFLKEFVKTDEVEWAHLDIAGPVWDDKGVATGYGAALLAQFASTQGGGEEAA